jgi:hypothetical protein
MWFVPSEFNISGIYFPPLLLAGICGLAAAVATQKWLGQSDLASAFANPPLVFFALTTIYTVVFGSTLFPI